MPAPVGRPRTVSPQPDEMILLGAKMLKWITENDPLHISEWFSLVEGISYKDWDTMIKRPEFVPYYEQALFLIGRKYLDKNSNVRENASQRWQRSYFKDLRDREDEEVRQKQQLEIEKANSQHGKGDKDIHITIAKYND